MVQTLHRKAPQSARLAIVPGTYKLKKIENHYFIKGFPETLKKACPDSRSWDTFFTLSSEKAEELRVVTAVLGDMKSLLQKAFTVGKIIKIQSVELKKKKNVKKLNSSIFSIQKYLAVLQSQKTGAVTFCGG